MSKPTILTKFNTTEITTFGNGGGVRVKLSPTNAEQKASGLSGNIELELPTEGAAIADFTHGEYEVTFTKVG